jgi:hypothetical protein
MRIGAYAPEPPPHNDPITSRGMARRGAGTIQRGHSAAFLIRLSCDEPRDQERQRDDRREDENNAEEENDHRPPRERGIVVADRREEAPEGVWQAEVPSVGVVSVRHPLGGVWSVQRALNEGRGNLESTQNKR